MICDDVEYSMVDRIIIDPQICNGKPVIRGTRITAQSVLEFLAAGDSVDDILADFPKLQREDIEACLQYASELMGNRFSLEAAS